MKTKQIIFPLMAVSSGILGNCCIAHPKNRPEDKRPNIIIILADDLGYSDIGCYGGEIMTPNLDRLAEEGIRFTQFYNAGRSCPTRASLLTGLYQHQAGIGRMTFDNGLPGYRGTLSHNAVTIAEVLSSAGYKTSMVGKWHVAETPLRPDQRDWLNHQVFYEQFADLDNYPVNRGFESHYGTIYGVVDYFDPFSLVEGEKAIDDIPEGFYITQAYSDRAVREIYEFSEDNKPFFMYLAYSSPHWPLHALPEDIAKYNGKYDCGWQQIRENRYNKQCELGLWGEQTNVLTERQFKDKWEENPHREWDARAMEVHAAMIDRMDQGIGQIITALEETGQMENTLILFLSDNGCSNEMCQRFRPGLNDRPDRTRKGEEIIYPKKKECMPGPETTYAALGPQWANVANTPFRFWKAKSYEGGICTPFIAHWPKGIKKNIGGITDEPGHVMDIMATCLDIGKAEYPKEFHGHEIIPLEGQSLWPIFRKGQRQGHKFIAFEHFNESALITSDNWKIVRPGKKSPWELYNLNEDRSEKYDLAEKYPDKVKKMVELYINWEKRCMVQPSPQKR